MKTTLKRTISFPQLLFYGIGTIVGGGFYALLGKIAETAEYATPIAFLFAGILALLNGLTYAELSSRFPFSAGEARYVDEAFDKKWLSIIVGLMVVGTGLISSATLSIATVGFLRDLVEVPFQLSIVVLVLCMGAISIWGVSYSVKAVLLITFIEVGVLVYIAFSADINGSNVREMGHQMRQLPTDFALLTGILSGAFLGFYAYIGFEDLANMAEEVVDPQRNLPKAIVTSVILTTILYMVVSIIVIASVPPRVLASASTPLATVFGGDQFQNVLFITGVSMLTGINGALVQVVMASRVLYGLGKVTPLLQIFSRVHKKTQTPIIATLLILCLILIFALQLPMISLAKSTSFIIISIFALLNFSLIVIKIKTNEESFAFKVPIWVPVLGFIACLGILAFQLIHMIP